MAAWYPLTALEEIYAEISHGIVLYSIQYTCMLSAHVQPGQHVALASATGVCAGLASSCDSLFLIVV